MTGTDGVSLDTLVGRLQATAVEALSGLGGDSPFALVDFPDHGNVGDSAIWLGETTFFLEHRRAVPSYVCSIRAFSEAALRAAVPEGPIFIHGGGNFGDLWLTHQEFRERILDRFHDREIIQLPQSIHFANPGRTERVARAIERHAKFVLLVRDQHSYDFATANFACDVKLCPDMAFFLGAVDRKWTPEVDVFYLMRTDKERAVGTTPGRPQYSFRSADWLEENPWPIRWHRLSGTSRGFFGDGWKRASARRTQYDAVAWARVLRGCRLLSSGRVVITDRLHAHILSLLLGIPHAVLDNSYGKLRRFLDVWTGDAAGTYRAASPADAEHWAESMVAAAKTLS